ncbi:hypothetical protein [Nocardia sp. XZ_19_385]|uniref:hypothetical protein n=1 Tax=Nocardia sp. XZ_19_385 TaxID=2769488 RepID=UPI00188F3062|nr:hypothetical protein [Nocardia sp. XZ_19_385]
MNLSTVTTAAVAGLAAAALFAAGCDEAEKAVNKGGETPCSEFTKQDKEKQRTTVAKFLEQEQGGDVPNDQTVDRSLTAIELMCSAQANPDTPINKADLTGILVPK